jgi:hypothetical protein
MVSAECPNANLRTNTFKKSFRINTIARKNTCSIPSHSKSYNMELRYAKVVEAMNLSLTTYQHSKRENTAVGYS